MFMNHGIFINDRRLWLGLSRLVTATASKYGSCQKDDQDGKAITGSSGHVRVGLC